MYLYVSANFEGRAVVTFMVNSKKSFTWSIHVVTFYPRLVLMCYLSKCMYVPEENQTHIKLKL